MTRAEQQFEVEQFLFREAALLDSADYESWEALFAPDGLYWVPLTPDQTDYRNYVSLFLEDAILRDVRIRRLRQPHAWSQDPPTRTARLIGNVMVDESADLLRVRSTFQMSQWSKRRTQRQLAGHATHDLVPDGKGSWLIKLKRVDLLDCDGIQDPLEVFI